MTRCSSDGRFGRPAKRFTYDHLVKDCKQVTMVRCSKAYLAGPNIFTTLAECRGFCNVKLTTDSHVTTQPTTASTPVSTNSASTASTHTASGSPVKATPTWSEKVLEEPHKTVSDQAEQKPRPHCTSTSKQDCVSNDKDEKSSVVAPEAHKSTGNSNLGAATSYSTQLVHHCVYLWTFSLLLLATTL